MTIELTGKRILVIGGSPRERVDSFRLYANHARSDNHGQRVWAELLARGYEATLVEAAHNDSAADLLKLCQAEISSGRFEIILQLANISQLKCPAPVDGKISKTGENNALLFEVEGNIDFFTEIQRIKGNATLAGYDKYQEWDGREELYHLCNIPQTKNKAKVDCNAPIDNSLEGKFVVVTAARTEDLLTKDGVTIINPFTGRQGQSIAKAFANRGAEVILISGPTILLELSHPNITNVHTTTFAELMAASHEVLLQSPDAYISSAAIADFGVPEPLDIMLKPGEKYTLQMQENPSIVSTIANHPSLRPPIVVSFAAQSPESILQYAGAKFKKLGVDMTVANPIGKNTAGAKDSTKNQVYIFTAQGMETVAETSKDAVGDEIAIRVGEMLKWRSKVKPPQSASTPTL